MSTGEEEQRILDFLEEEKEEFNFIPDITCSHSANNGVLKISVNNIDELWIHNEFEPSDPYSPCFKITCKCINIDLNEQQDKRQWDDIIILVGNIEDDGTFYLLMEVQLDSYNFVFKIQAHDKKANKWMDKTKQQFIVNVPSFLFDIKYVKDEWVDFRKIGEYQPRLAQIIDILDNDMFQLKYDEYDESKDDGSFLEKKIIVHLSRLYKQSIDNQFVTRVHSPHRLENDLLLRRTDKESREIFNALMTNYTVYSLIHCHELYPEFTEKVLIHFKPIAYLVSINIFQFLFEPRFEFKINCIINCWDGCMKFNTVRQNHINLLIDHPIKSDECDSDFDIIDHDLANVAEWNDIKYTCDFCMVDLSQFDYYYSCDININDKHDLCLNCVSRVIRLNAELKVILMPLLKDQLILPLIDIIADFVIGAVRVIDLCCNEQYEINSNKKRKLSSCDTTPNKRRKLDSNL